EKLSLSGKAKLVNLWKSNGNDWHGNYYLTSKDDSDNKLSIKYGDANWSIDLADGLFVQDLLPDSVKIYVSRTNGSDSSALSETDQSNLDAYRAKITTENTNNKYSKYKLGSDGKLYLTVSGKPDVELNPIKVSHLEPGYSSKVLFKAKYLFDETGIYNGDIFGTKLKFKKGARWDGEDKTRKEVLDSTLISTVWYGANYIPGSTKAIPDKPTTPPDFVSGSNLFEYFWKGKTSNGENNDNDVGFTNSINGEENSPTGSGYDQLIETDHQKNNDQINKINQGVNEGTNYLIYSRIAYRNGESNEQFGYLWSNTVTILYVEPKTATQNS
ncbi:hypothetical protein LNO75_03925, partial [Mycoplasma sp. T363T]|uniref:hypothetical protein n=1 Tax=Mycoplasma bradburyae TaxID=2963128 RepID=UPI002341F1E3